MVLKPQNSHVHYLLCLGIIIFNVILSPLLAQNKLEIVVGRDSVTLLFPEKKPIGQILILPGWNFNRKKCCAESNFCHEALKKGYILVLPEISKGVYATKIYPQTRPDWQHYPQMTWLKDTLMPFLQTKYAIFKSGQGNYVFGISTGGRGVALLLEQTKSLFMAGAALSGDYDQTQFPKDNLMIGYYGPMAKFPDRWEGVDNPSKKAALIETPIYLGHGLADNLIPPAQSQCFYKIIAEKGPHQLHMAPGYGHNYAYWESETKNVLLFFEKHVALKNQPKN